MKKVIFILILGALFSCKKEDKVIIYEHINDNISYNMNFLYDSIEERKKIISVRCFFSSIKFDSVKYDFKNSDFGWLIDTKLKNIKEARIMFNNRIFYAYEHYQVGLVYAVEFDSKYINSFKLKSHPSFDSKFIDSLLIECINYRDSVENFIYRII